MRRFLRRKRVRGQKDEGAILITVLVFTVVASLVVIPLLSYQITVLRANKILSARTARVEAVKAGLRLALADPSSLYVKCGDAGPNTPVTLASLQMTGLPVTTKCYFLDYRTAQDTNQMRYGLAVTQVGQTIPTALSGSRYTPSNASDPEEWRSATTTTSTTNKIWLPNLPSHAVDLRSPSGFTMPAEYGTCTVFFPGTYTDPVTLSGPVYFASGVYYFANTVTVAAGATVVVGLGANEGCTTDQDAVFYAVNAPVTHNVTGLGGTFVFGGAGRLLINNAASGTGTSFVMNSRYVNEDDATSDTSAGVSLATVNGIIEDGEGKNLTWSGQLSVPVSLVGADGATSVTAGDYTPSTLTPKPSVPGTPSGVTATAYNTSAVVSWTAPSTGGADIASYRVTASNGAICTTNGATKCAFTGLVNGTAYSFAVTATNSAGTSAAGTTASTVTPSAQAVTLAVPAQPAAPTAVAYNASAQVSFTATAASTAPVTSYVVTASPGGRTCTVNVDTATTPTLRCNVTGLTNDTSHTFSVTAVNAVGGSTASASSAAVTPTSSLANPPSDSSTPSTTYQPTPVVEIAYAGVSGAKVYVPGYVSVPQGRFRVANPNGADVRFIGGILAAQFDITDSRGSTPQSVPIGFVEVIVQRLLRLVSTTAGRETSVAIVQVNQNGAYAVNSWEVQ